MAIKITALGTGAAETVKYFQTAFYVQDEKTNLTIEIGGVYKVKSL